MQKLFQFVVFLFLFGVVNAQQTNVVDFKTSKASLRIDKELKLVSGKVMYEFDILSAVDTVFLDAVGFDHISVFHVGNGFDYTYDGQRLQLLSDFKAGATHKIELEFRVSPKKAMYFVDDQIWTQGQGKNTSYWLPSIDDVNDKIEFDIAITFDNGYDVVANGNLVNKMVGDAFTTWYYDMEKPMSSYLVAIAIGVYDNMTEFSKSGIPLEYYYYPEDTLKVAPTYRYSKQMFDFLEEEIGVPYPWHNYKQVPVKDFLYAGMENTSLTIFSDSFVVDTIGSNDKNYITVNAHELAHQWFGDLVTATSSEHHWLQEGFATYYALLAERHIFGDDHYYWQLFENAQELIAQDKAGQSTALLDPKSSSSTFYKKGAWALHILREKVGDTAFKLAVRRYLEKHKFGNVTTNDFISEVEKSSQQDLSLFTKEWLTAVALPEDAMVRSLKTSSFMRDYLAVNCEEYSQKCTDYLMSNSSDKVKIKVVSQTYDHLEASAFANSLEVRQAIAQYLSTIPEPLKPMYESLLNDASYVTMETALYNLWVNFPLERAKYLERTKNTMGFSDYNVRMLWLVLHLNTIEYQPEKKQDVLKELIGYSMPTYHFEARLKAFGYLKLIDAFELQSLASLMQATKHPNWQFSKFAKRMIFELEQEPNYKEILEQLKNEQ